MDGYDGQSLVIMDEMTQPWVNIAYLLKLTDVWPLRVNVRGGTVAWRPTKIIIISNCSLSEMFPTASVEVFQALIRRITKMEHYDVPFSDAAGDSYTEHPKFE